jgi:hypothetical protein
LVLRNLPRGLLIREINAMPRTSDGSEVNEMNTLNHFHSGWVSFYFNRYAIFLFIAGLWP